MVTQFVIDPNLERARERLEVLPSADQMTALGLQNVEARSPIPEALVDCHPYHGLVMAAHLAFAHHYPLTLSPDHVWLCIAQAAARHVLNNADALRGRLVRHDGKVELHVRRDEFIPGHADNDWPGVMAEISDQLREHLGGRRDLFVCDFSTTGAVARTASEIVLMSAMQRFFEYSVGTLCGIPEVRLEGTEADWASIVRRVRALEELDLGWWTKHLGPAVEALHDTARGRGDAGFWKRMYKLEHASGGDRISGWINILFPYLADETEPESLETRLEPEHEFHLPKVGDFPVGLTRAPFTWEILGQPHAMQVVAGFFGVSQDPDTLHLRPQLGWAVTPAQPDRQFIRSRSHDDAARFVPRTAKTLTSLASLAAEAEGLGPTHLSLWWCAALETLDGLEHVPTLESLDALECNRLQDIAPLAGHRALRSLHLSQCKALADVSALASLPELRKLALTHLPVLTDVSTIAKLDKLERVDLHGCAAVPEPLRRRHEGPAEIEALKAALQNG